MSQQKIFSTERHTVQKPSEMIERVDSYLNLPFSKSAGILSAKILMRTVDDTFVNVEVRTDDYERISQTLQAVLKPDIGVPSTVEQYKDMCVRISRVVGFKHPIYNLPNINTVLRTYETGLEIQYNEHSLLDLPSFTIIDITKRPSAPAVDIFDPFAADDPCGEYPAGDPTAGIKLPKNSVYGECDPNPVD